MTELLPIGTKVILTDIWHADGLSTVITGYDGNDHEMPYYVRAKGRDNYPGAHDEIEADTESDGGCEPLTKAEQLRALAKRLDAAWNEISEVNAEVQAVAGYVRAAGTISDALGRLAIAHREVAAEAGRVWVEKND